jgi:hypothetical protein
MDNDDGFGRRGEDKREYETNTPSAHTPNEEGPRRGNHPISYYNDTLRHTTTYGLPPFKYLEV